MEPLYSKILRNSEVMDNPALQDLVKLAIYVRDHTPMFSGRFKLHFENVVSHAVALIDPAITIRNDALDKAWAETASVIGNTNKVLAGKATATIKDLHQAAIETVTHEHRIVSMNAEDADKAIRAKVQTLAEQFPELGLSCGYIGNCGHNFDDRSWKVFTKLRNNDGHGSSVSFGGYPTERIGALALEVEAGLEDWCRNTLKRLKAGSYRAVA
ncbi:MAG: hypothetical protein CL949_20460 [Erythrobacter sp.]|nr:hypothetical protein [Erythrobacter sp.]